MFINPKVAIEKGWVKFPDWMNEGQRNRCIQPNALDFTLDKLFTIKASNTFSISEDSKTMRGGDPTPLSTGVDGTPAWMLAPKECYDGMSDFYVDVPEGVAAMLVTRSTFNRNGVFIQSGLYDSGYRGACGYVIYNMGGAAFIAPNTRIGQLIFIESENALMYAGGYNHKEGTHYTENK